MMQLTRPVGSTARRISTLTLPLLVAASGTAVADGGGSYSSGMMSGGWGLFGSTMGLFGLLWMGVLLAVPLYLVYALTTRPTSERDNDSLSILRERYARGELSDEEFERRRTRLERTG